MGNPNTGRPVNSGPPNLSLHERALLYIDNPPEFTYGDLKFIVQTLKSTGSRITGKPIRVGTTFDPGPEFAKSDFKYKRHREILGGNAMGPSSFVSCYSILHADTTQYAGFPEGIPEGTPFGVFFGRQSHHFLKDLDFDFLWLSNGFGFGAEGWASTGALFNGSTFQPGKLPEVRTEILDFWKFFRKECPGFRVETRGTNLSTGIDLARDGVDLKSIYEGAYNILPPPNSPWAALDGDFGLEMTGFMSRMAMLPDNRFPFRYYTHDPWWVNSPWLDRYGSEPHDIYLPMSVCRIDSLGNIGNPTQLNLLSIDNSYGDMPTEVPDEVTPHLLKGRYDQPSAPGPLVWVYPFDEYHRWAYNEPSRLPEIYYGDWYIRQAINNGFPLNTVISTTAFQQLATLKPDYFGSSILVTIAPDAGSLLETALMNFVKKGGKLLIYGPADHISPAFSSFLNLKNDKPLQGIFRLSGNFQGIDTFLDNKMPDSIQHRSSFCGGGLNTLVKNPADRFTSHVISLYQGKVKRDEAWVREDPSWNGGIVAYVRGTNSASFRGGKLLTPDDPGKWFIGGNYIRYILQGFGVHYAFEKASTGIQSPILTISRSNNAYFFSGYVPNTTVKQVFSLPQGAPVFTGYQTKLEEGRSTYYMPTAWHKECRVFVTQDKGILSCKEGVPGQKDVSRRIEISGLENATVRIFPPDTVAREKLVIHSNAGYPWKKKAEPLIEGEKAFGRCYVVKNVTGRLTVSW
jgi:hypothetical protein